MSKIVKNNSDQDLTIPNVGIVKAGETVEVPDNFNNANFSEVKSDSKKESKSEPSGSEKESGRGKSNKNKPTN